VGYDLPYPTDVAVSETGRVFVSSGGGAAVYESVGVVPRASQRHSIEVKYLNFFPTNESQKNEIEY
jgi:hypothetical protein